MQAQPYKGYGSLAALLTATAAITCGTIAVRPASAVVTFNLTYDDVVNNTGVGFDDPTYGATRRNTVTAVMNYLSSVIDANGSADIEIQNSFDNPNSSELAHAGSNFFTGPNGFNNGLVFQHLTTGVDPLMASYDGQAQFNFTTFVYDGQNYTWNNGLSAPTFYQFDLFSVTLHEFTHALGFLSLTNSDGTSGISGGNPGVFSVYDSYLHLGDGTALFDSGGHFIGTTADLTSNDVFFTGPNAEAANSGNPVQVYDPTSGWEDGSSLSHLNNSDDVMYYATSNGQEHRAYSDIDRGILMDLGYTLYPVPEPASLAFFALAGLVLYRRRRSA